MKSKSTWYSHRMRCNITLARWGHFGRPVLLFPTAGGDAEECERFLMIKALSPLIDEGRIKVYSCDSVSGRVWTDGRSSGATRAWMQNRFDDAVYHEILPAIRLDCRTPDIGIIAAGASIGAFNALAAVCRHPDAFELGICMSGTYDMTRWMNGQHTLDLHFSSPLHFLPNLSNGPHLDLLRTRSIILATGEGRYEAPAQSWSVAHVLGLRRVPNRVDLWGVKYEHDWITWRDMLPTYLSLHA